MTNRELPIFYLCRIVASTEPLPDAVQASLLEATRQWGRACNRLDAALLPSLHPELIYESQTVLNPLRGSKEVSAYVARKFDRIAAAGDGMAVTAEIAHVDLPEAAGYPCLLARQGGKPVCLIKLKVDDAGLVERVDFLVVAPTPDCARGTGEFPI